MKITIVSTYNKGGAGIAALRLHLGLLAIGINSRFLVLHNSKEVTDTHVIDVINRSLIGKILRQFKIKSINRISTILLKNKPEGYDYFTAPYSFYDLHNHPLIKDADIVNLHWVSNLLDYKSFFKNVKQPLIWTLHDMNTFTGGCHYSGNCEEFKNDCNECPQLSISNRHLSNDFLSIKHNTTKNSNITVVTPSNWLSNLSKSSLVFNKFNHNVIPYGININTYTTLDKNKCKDSLGIDKNKNVILFVADYKIKRKGLDIFMEAINTLNNEYLICLLGVKNDNTNNSNIIDLGRIDDEQKQCIIYNAADVYVIPSLEDNLPNTILESMSCGTPVIGFNKGGIPEIVKNNYNGLISEPNSNDLKNIIEHFFENPNKIKEMGINARKTIEENYSIKKSANRYLTLFNNLLKK